MLTLLDIQASYFGERNLTDRRMQVEALLLRFPGLHFREIKRRLNLGNGTLEHHLRALTRSGIIEPERDGQFVRFYPSFILHDERRLISILRQSRLREIVTFLSSNPKSNRTAIVQELNLSSSTLSWHLARLEQIGIVRREKNSDGLTCFTVTNPQEVFRIISTYKLSVLDKVIDGFLDTWEHL